MKRSMRVFARIVPLLLILAISTTGCVNQKNPKKKRIESKINKIESLIEKNYLNGVDEDNVESYIYKGYVAGLDDPYSTYYTAKEYKAMMESISGTYYGIGVTVTQDSKTGVISFVKPFKDGPGYKAGILPGDVLLKVDGKEYGGEDLTEVVSWIKGEKGTKVTLTIYREGEFKEQEVIVTRDEVDVPTVEHQMLSDRIGYISVTEFDEITLSQFVKAVDDLEAQGMNGLIVDLRNNPGGRLDIVVDMLDRILPKGLLVYTEDRNGKRNEYWAKDDDQINVPLAVLTNGNSASASEIFAGAIKDYNAGTLVGTTTYGKGVVQRTFELGDGSAVKLTISKYFTPKGNNIHGIGIEPDVEIDLDEKLKKKPYVDIKEDNQINKAIEVIKGEK